MRWAKVKRPIPRGLMSKALMLLSVLGPGFITANVNNDAGGIATFSTAGGYPFGYTCLWALFPITAVLIVTQLLGVRMGAVTGKGLADLIREEYGLRVTFYLMCGLLLVNACNTVAEFAGVAASAEIFGVPKFASVPIAAAVVWLLIVRGTYKSVEKVFLVASTFYGAYIVSGVLAKPDWGAVAVAAAVPQIPADPRYLYMLVGLLGAAVAPWMQFYVQAATVEKGIAADNYPMARWDAVIGCVTSSLVAFFIIVACGATLGNAGIAVHSGAEAAQALAPFAGRNASLLFAFGLFSASLFAASILPLSTAYTICEGLGFEAGVNKTFKEAPHFYGLYTAQVLFGAVAVLWPHFPLFRVMVFSQVLNGLLLPILMWYVLQLARRRDVMGEFATSVRAHRIYVVVIALIAVADGVMVWQSW